MVYRWGQAPAIGLLEGNGAETHAARSTDGREEGCECGYYNLHRNLNETLFHTPLAIKSVKSVQSVVSLLQVPRCRRRLREVRRHRRCRCRCCYRCCRRRQWFRR